MARLLVAADVTLRRGLSFFQQSFERSWQMLNAFD
jgi:hypothetical protein